MDTLWALLPIFALLLIIIGIKEAIDSIRNSRREKKDAAWKEVQDSLTEEQRAALHVAFDTDPYYAEREKIAESMTWDEYAAACSQKGVEPIHHPDISFSDSFRRAKTEEHLELAMNPDWVAANRELIERKMEDIRRIKQRGALDRMKKKLR